MVTVALYVKLEAKRGKEAEVESFLKGGLAIVQEEPATTRGSRSAWAPRPSASSTPFRTKRAGRPTVGPRRGGAHGEGGRPARQPPSIERIDVLAAKLP